MNITATVLLAFGMSMDAFAASIGKRVPPSINRNFSEALRTGLNFLGAVENLTPSDRLGNGHVSSRLY